MASQNLRKVHINDYDEYRVILGDALNYIKLVKPMEWGYNDSNIAQLTFIKLPRRKFSEDAAIELIEHAYFNKNFGTGLFIWTPNGVDIHLNKMGLLCAITKSKDMVWVIQPMHSEWGDLYNSYEMADIIQWTIDVWKEFINIESSELPRSVIHKYIKLL